MSFRAGIFGNNLHFDTIIPIALTKFDIKEFIFDEYTSIEEIKDSLHKARFPEWHENNGIHERIIGAATHCLRLKGWKFEKNEGFFSDHGTGTVSNYPVKQVDNFFTALRLSADIPTGYAQVLYEPFGWVKRYKADVAFIYRGRYVRKYPPIFEQNYRIPDTSFVVTKEVLQETQQLYKVLMETDKNQFQIASQRLNSCYLRENEEDTILDATIALEALLTSNTNTETTYRLALRLAALSSLAKNYEYTPLEIYKSVKKIYDFRSAVIHGSSKTDKKREISLQETQKIPAVSLAIKYLRMALKTLLQYPKYLDEKNDDNLIDSEILLKVKGE